MPFSLPDSITYAQCVQVAETVDSGNNPVYNNLPPGFVVAQALFANDLATIDNNLPDYLPFGFVARNGSTVIVAIRGTSTILEWVEDADFKLIPCPINGSTGRTEDGFSDVYESLGTAPQDNAPGVISFLQGYLQAGDSLVIAGHSLGAALATLCGYDAALNLHWPDLNVYTFASPNVGDGAFASAYNNTAPNTWRVANPLDIVTHVPPRFILGYQAVGTTHLVNPSGQVKFNILCEHHLTTYLHLLTQQDGITPTPLDPECVASQARTM